MESREPPGQTARILFLYSDTGGGHRAAAAAIDAALQRIGGDQRIEAHHVDAFAACGVFPLRESVASYGAMLKVQPSPYPALYHLSNGQTRFRVISELGMPFIRRNLRRTLASTTPDIVVSVHPLLNVYARRLIASMDLRCLLVTVITDLVTLHHSWTAGAAADEYVVPSPEAGALCVARGIPASRVHDLGLPIRDGFRPAAPGEQAAIRRALGLDPEKPVLLVMAGGEGGGRVRKMLSDVAPTIDAIGLQCVVIAGRNEALRRKLEDMPAHAATWRVVGFVDAVADYMRAADVLLTKAGPGAIVEAAASGLPVVLFEYISGQERGNLDYVQSRGAGIVALDSGAVAAALGRLFAPHAGERTVFRRRALASARPHAADDIARFLLGLLEQKPLVRSAPRASL